MKLLLALILLTAGALTWVVATRPAPTFAAPEPAPAAFAPAPTVLVHGPAPGQIEQDFDVQGMCCKGCTGKLHARLLAVEGVREAAVDFETGSARVVTDADVSTATLVSALSFEKYNATPRSAH
jgi:copper chaperone CopZ